jgi:hypothetical protein
MPHGAAKREKQMEATKVAAHTPYQILRETANGPCVDCFRTAAAARHEVDAINQTRATRKHGMRATYCGHIERVGDVWQELVRRAAIAKAGS